MNVEELYSLSVSSPLGGSNDITELVSLKLDLFPELAISNCFTLTSKQNIINNNRKVLYRIPILREWHFNCYKDRLNWLFICLFYEDSPFMFLRNPSHLLPSDNYTHLFVTNSTLYQLATYYLYQLLQADLTIDLDYDYHLTSGSIMPHLIQSPVVIGSTYTNDYINNAINNLINNHL